MNASRSTAGVGVTLSRVGKTYRNGMAVLRDIDLTIAPGEFVSLVGISGCGKSSLLRLLAGLGQPSSGAIVWTGAGASGPDLSLVFQEPTLMPWRTVFDNVHLPLKLAGCGRAAGRDRVMAALDAMALRNVADIHPRQLSGGMRMRVSIARALVSGPRVLLMDEPFAALDEITRGRLSDDLLSLQRRHGLTVVFVTHNVAEAVFLSTRVVVLRANPGRIAADLRIALPPLRDRHTRASADYAATCMRVSDLLQAASLDMAPGLPA